MSRSSLHAKSQFQGFKRQTSITILKKSITCLFHLPRSYEDGLCRSFVFKGVPRSPRVSLSLSGPNWPPWASLDTLLAALGRSWWDCPVGLTLRVEKEQRVGEMCAVHVRNRPSFSPSASAMWARLAVALALFKVLSSLCPPVWPLLAYNFALFASVALILARSTVYSALASGMLASFQFGPPSPILFSFPTVLLSSSPPLLSSSLFPALVFSCVGVHELDHADAMKWDNMGSSFTERIQSRPHPKKLGVGRIYT